jgi:predicted glutamine amidotransferase
MCVIAVKKPGVNVPDQQNIKDMWETNSDGAGFMYAINGKVYIEKGYMKLDQLTTALKMLDKRVYKKDGLTLKDIPMVFHFRIKTHGANNPANTHPFPISSKEQHLKALDLTAGLGVVHNGIITSVKAMGDMSDTMSYIANVLTPLAMLDSAFYKKEYGKTLMENTIGYSKLAFLDKNGDIELVGDFKNGTKEGTNEILYSNLSHEYKGTYIYGTEPYAANYYTTQTSFENLKEVPVGYYLGYETAFNDKDETIPTIPVKSAETYYMDEDGFIYVKTKPGVFMESASFMGVYKDAGKEYLDEVSFKSIPMAVIYGEVTSSLPKGGKDDDLDKWY